jgi:hypothetical protein
MRANLASRLRRLETRQTAISEKTRPIIQFADVKGCPTATSGSDISSRSIGLGASGLLTKSVPGQARISKPIPTASWCSSCRARGNRSLPHEFQLPSADAKRRGSGMKAVIRRLHQLERQLAPQPAAVSSLSLSLAAVIRERRRRRCEASGEPLEELPVPPLVAPGKLLSYAETLRLARQRAYEQNRARSAQIATDPSDRGHQDGSSLELGDVPVHSHTITKRFRQRSTS